MKLNDLMEKKDPYQEEAGGTFTHDGDDYDLNALLKLTDGAPVAYFKIKDLKWLLPYETDESDEEQRVQNADLSKPVLVGVYRKKWVILDGLHRLKKAAQEEIEELPGRVVSDAQLEKVKIK